MSLAQGNNTPTRPRIEPGSPDPESDALTTRPVRPHEVAFVSRENSDQPGLQSVASLIAPDLRYLNAYTVKSLIRTCLI